MEQFLELATNFHFLFYLMTNHLVQFTELEMQVCFVVTLFSPSYALASTHDPLREVCSDAV